MELSKHLSNHKSFFVLIRLLLLLACLPLLDYSRQRLFTWFYSGNIPCQSVSLRLLHINIPNATQGHKFYSKALPALFFLLLLLLLWLTWNVDCLPSYVKLSPCDLNAKWGEELSRRGMIHFKDKCGRCKNIQFEILSPFYYTFHLQSLALRRGELFPYSNFYVFFSVIAIISLVSLLLLETK